MTRDFLTSVPFLLRIFQQIRDWTKPASGSLIADMVADLTRSRADLVIENAMLRQQLIVLNRQVQRPEFTRSNHFLLVLLARCTGFWQQALHIVQPDTLLRWHRDMFRRYWDWKSRRGRGRPDLSPEIVELIRKLAKENVLWGAERIRGELLKLGYRVSKRTIQKYLPAERETITGSQTWATFVKNHAGEIWACDFTVAYDWLFRAWYIFVLMDIRTRQIVHTAVTRFPTDEWTSQQLREALAWCKGPKYLLRDRDSKYGQCFAGAASSMGIEELKTPYRMPQVNGICERFMGSLRRECLDHTLILQEKHLGHVVKDYVAYF
jgi:putative transposase